MAQFFAQHSKLIDEIGINALLALSDRGEPLDKVSLAEELRARGMLDKVGGLAYLSTLMDTVPTAASAEYYARIVAEKAAHPGGVQELHSIPGYSL